jgi:hypothetical protein
LQKKKKNLVCVKAKGMLMVGEVPKYYLFELSVKTRAETQRAAL